MVESIVERVPYDVWANISQFIPRNVLCTLSGVNRSFYEIATVTRYETVRLRKFDRNTKWFCRILVDPDTRRGELVRRLHIRPWLVQPRIKSCRNQTGNIWSVVSCLLDFDSDDRQMDQLVKKRIQKDITRATEALDKMKNLTEYNLDWDQNCQYHAEFFRAFLCPPLTRMKDTLVKLSLKVPPSMLRSLAPIALPHLEHLEVTVSTLEMPRREVDEIFDSFTVFVNNLYPTLLSLKFASVLPSHFLDFTRLFTNLGTFPHLNTFSLCLPFDGGHLSAPFVLVAFLNKHRATLQHLSLSTTRCAVADGPIDRKCKYWIPNILTALRASHPHTHLHPQFRGIRLALRPLKANLSPVTDFLGQHAPTVVCLSLTDRSLTYAEVRTILHAITSPRSASSLKHLELRVKHLSSALLDLLAEELPRLTHLKLQFNEVISTAAHVTAGYPPKSRRAELDMFCSEVRDKRQNYAQWELTTLGVPQGPQSCPWLVSLEKLFIECIPALRNFVELPNST